MNGPDNKKIYDEKWEDWVDMKRYGAASRWLRTMIADHLRPQEVRARIHTVLDLGSGEGTITHEIAEQLPNTQVLGTDFSKSGIDISNQAYKLPNLRFEHDSKSKCLEQKYDLVTAFEVLEHIDDWQVLLGRMADASSKYLMLSFPTGRMRPFEVNVGHYRNYKKGQIEEFLAMKGFKPVQVFYAGFPFYSPLYREFCNMTNAANNSFTQGKFNTIQKAVAWCIYVLFRYASTKHRWGDQFCGFFVRQ